MEGTENSKHRRPDHGLHSHGQAETLRVLTAENVGKIVKTFVAGWAGTLAELRRVQEGSRPAFVELSGSSSSSTARLSFTAFGDASAIGSQYSDVECKSIFRSAG